MSKCLKCGAQLPAFGECSECHAPNSVAPKVPPLLEQELHGPARPTVETQRSAAKTPPPAIKGRPLSASPLPTLPSVPARIPPRPPVPAPDPQIAFRAHEIQQARHRPRFEDEEEETDSEAKTRIVSVGSIAGWPGASGPAEPSIPPPTPRDEEPFLEPEPGPTQILAVPKRPAPSNAPSETVRKAAEPRTPRAPAPGEVHAAIAPVWRRLVAGTVDFGAICAVAGLYLAIALAVTGRKAPHTTLTGLDGLMITLHGWQPVVGSGLVLTALLAAAYSVAFTVMWDGRTPGRKLMGLKLVDMSGSAPAPALAMKRALLCWLSALVFLGGYWLMLFDRRRQSLHDKLTQTFIVLPGLPTA